MARGKKLNEEEKLIRKKEIDEKELKRNEEIKKLLEKHKIVSCIKVEHEDFIEYDFCFGFNFKPYERTRKGQYGQMYDPLGKYKTEIKKILRHYLNIPARVKPDMLSYGMCEIELITNVKLPKSATKKQKLLALKNIYRPLQKPDIDNIEKTVYDILTNIIYGDDTQVVKINHEKFFRLQESTFMKIKIYKKDISIEGRINKEEEEELCRLMEQMKIY